MSASGEPSLGLQGLRAHLFHFAIGTYSMAGAKIGVLTMSGQVLTGTFRLYCHTRAFSLGIRIAKTMRQWLLFHYKRTSGNSISNSRYLEARTGSWTSGNVAWSGSTDLGILLPGAVFGFELHSGKAKGRNEDSAKAEPRRAALLGTNMSTGSGQIFLDGDVLVSA